MRTLKKFTSAVFIALASFSYTAQASLIIELDTIFDEDAINLKDSPAGSPSWLTATFESLNANTVRLTMDGMLQDPNEFVGGWYFNFNPAYNASDLAFSQVSASGAAFATSIDQGENLYQADGERFYDILFNMDIAPPADRFNGTDQLVYDIQRSDGMGGFLALSELDFDFFGVNGNEKGGPFTSAAHIQGLAVGEGSTWIGGDGEIVCTDPNGCDGGGPPTEIPEPSVLFLLGSALLALSLRKKTG
jgi:hypothetical protein